MRGLVPRIHHLAKKMNYRVMPGNDEGKVLACLKKGLGLLEESTSFRQEELLASSIAGLIGDARHVAVGASSPIPAAAAMLARERGGGRPYVSLLGSRRQSFFTDGGRELFDCAGQGRIDAFFFSGPQTAGEANITLGSSGDHAQQRALSPGSLGPAYLYCVVPRVTLSRPEHPRRTLVEK